MHVENQASEHPRDEAIRAAMRDATTIASVLDHTMTASFRGSLRAEYVRVLKRFADAMTIVGGSAPPFSPATGPTILGTLDVDFVVDPIGVPDEVYRTIAELLRERDHVQLDQPFRWLRSVTVDGRTIDVEVDLLAPVTPRTGPDHRHERIGGEPLARPGRGHARGPSGPLA